MKKVILGLLITFSITLTSCEKESLYQDEIDSCTCGTIANDGITNGCYWLEIRNDCSGNKKKFCFDQDVWMNNYPGDRFCVQGVDAW